MLCVLALEVFAMPQIEKVVAGAARLKRWQQPSAGLMIKFHVTEPLRALPTEHVPSVCRRLGPGKH